MAYNIIPSAARFSIYTYFIYFTIPTPESGTGYDIHASLSGRVRWVSRWCWLFKR